VGEELDAVGESAAAEAHAHPALAVAEHACPWPAQAERTDPLPLEVGGGGERGPPLRVRLASARFDQPRRMRVRRPRLGQLDAFDREPSLADEFADLVSLRTWDLPVKPAVRRPRGSRGARPAAACSGSACSRVSVCIDALTCRVELHELARGISRASLALAVRPPTETATPSLDQRRWVYNPESWLGRRAAEPERD
jgi:hypothetical protein